MKNTEDINTQKTPSLLPLGEAGRGFSFDELIYSHTAARHGIDNTPGEEEWTNLIGLVSCLLQPLRILYGKAIRVSSGYRCPEVNRLVGGARNSQHVRGEAADLCIPEGPRFLLDFLLESKLLFDQAIVYTQKRFLHLSYKTGTANRKQVLFR